MDQPYTICHVGEPTILVKIQTLIAMSMRAMGKHQFNNQLEYECEPGAIIYLIFLSRHLGEPTVHEEFHLTSVRSN